MTRDQLLELGIWVATNFDEEFIARFKLGQKILVGFNLDLLYYEIICLGKYDTNFYSYTTIDQLILPIISFCNTLLYTIHSNSLVSIHTKYLSLCWLEHFIKYQNDR